MSNDLKVTLSLVDDFTRKLTGIEANLGSFGQKIDNINKIAARFGLGFGLGFAGFKIVDEIKGLVDEAKEYTKVQNQLRESLGYTSIELEAQSETLGKKYLIDDREIQKVQQRIALYTQDEDAIKSLTDATLNYAAATGKDALGAVTMVDKAIISAKGTLKGFPGHLDGAAESSERLASIAATLNERMGGQAEAVAESKTWWDRLKVSVDNVRESVAIGVFGKEADKELLRYKAAKEFIENITSEEAKATLTTQWNYESELKIVQDFEKKINDAKMAAKEEAREKNLGIVPSVTPGFKDSDAAEKARQKQAEDEKKERIKIKEETAKAIADQESFLANDEIARMRSQGAAREAEDKQLEEEERKRNEQRKKWVSESHEDSVKILSEYHKKVEEDEKRHNELMVNTARSMGTAYGRAIGVGIGKGKDGLKTAFKGILSITVDFIEKEMLAAIASNTLQEVTKFGWYGLISGAAKAVAITAVGEGAKAGINSFSMGTSSASGGPAFVHKDESIYLPAGSAVKTASETREITENNNGGNTFNLNIMDSGGTLKKVVTEIRDGSESIGPFAEYIKHIAWGAFRW